ncbi:MAG: hypothetical protein R3250_04075 [Melioribacteraceae bacterium]|nr:hypothetical protein [Melioribacteraceae bacterium]
MPIWSDKCIDESAGFDVDPITKQAKPRKLGAWVMTIEECKECLKERRKKWQNK